MFEAGKQPSKLRPVMSALGAGFRQLVLRRGLLRGADGWTIAVTSVFRSYMKYAKLNELHERAADDDRGLKLGAMRDAARR